MADKSEENVAPESEQQVADTKEPADVREGWSGKLDFILSCIGYSVGLGNVWRFPYLCYRNGGGAFLIPYVIMMAICGLPLMLLELGVGQFCSLGPVTLWKLSPMFKGVGWAMMVIGTYITIYYNVIIAWVLFYFFASLTSELPWQSCDHVEFSPLCSSSRGNLNSIHEMNRTTGEPYLVENVDSSFLNRTWGNGSIVQCAQTMPPSDGQTGVCCNLTRVLIYELSEFDLKLVSPSQEYWDKKVLQKSSSIENGGEVLWDLTLCLLLAWIIIFGCIAKGVKSSGKVVYFTAIFPYVMLTILVIRGALLDGAIDGITYYIKPNLEELGNAAIWRDAAVQVFYSMGVACGGLHTMASYNKFNNNIVRDVLIVSFADLFTSVYAGFAVFSMIGYISYTTLLPVKDAVTSGQGLAFVAYPEGLTTIPVAPLWSVLFFAMLFTLGLDSQFATCEGVITGIVDEFPWLKGGKWRRMIVTGVYCSTLFLLGLPMTTRGGIYWFSIMDTYSGGMALLVIGLSEIIAIIYVYGCSRFVGDLEQMVGQKKKWSWMYFKVCWWALTPLSVVFILIFQAIDYTPVVYETYTFPAWADTIGWLMIASSLVFIPLWALVVFCQRTSVYKMCPRFFRPAEDWGPALPENQLIYKARLDTACSHWEDNGNLNMSFNTEIDTHF